MDYNEIRDLLPAYALGAVEPEEREQIEAALAKSPELREELATYAPVMEALALSVPQMKPPSDLGDRILRAATAQPVVRRFPVTRFLAVAAAVVLVLVGVLLVQLLDEDDDTPNPPSASQQIAAIMDDPDSARIELTGVEENQEFAQVHGELIVAPGHHQAVLHLANLPHPPDKHYQLWFVRDEERFSAAVFVPEWATSEKPLLIELPENFASYQGMGITVEPIGGSPEPTGDAVLRAPLELTSEQ